jgi:5'-3' exonuclease
MVEFETDDALATAAARWAEGSAVEQVVIATADKDMAQCVQGTRVVCFDRMRRRLLDETAVVAKFGVAPASIPDWLALVGDSADGVPGIPRWGKRSASAVLAHYGHLESIPDDPSEWGVAVRGATSLAESLSQHRREALLYRRLTRLRTDVPLRESLLDLRWKGFRGPALDQLCHAIGDNGFAEQARRLSWRPHQPA